LAYTTVEPQDQKLAVYNTVIYDCY